MQLDLEYDYFTDYGTCMIFNIKRLWENGFHFMLMLEQKDFEWIRFAQMQVDGNLISTIYS